MSRFWTGGADMSGVVRSILRKERRQILEECMSELERLAFTSYLRGKMSLYSLAEVVDFSRLKARLTEKGVTFVDLV